MQFTADGLRTCITDDVRDATAIKLIGKLKELIDRLCKHNIIEKYVPSEWLHHLVIIEKPDKSLRMCLDHKELIKCILREIVQIPTLDEVRDKLMAKNYFTLLDLRKGFYQCKLENDSKRLCAFSTPLGRISF